MRRALSAFHAMLGQLLSRSFLERVGVIGHEVGADLPEEDAAEALLHGPFGLDGDRFGVVVADHDLVVGGDQPGVLGLVVPDARPAFFFLELVEVTVVAARERGLGCVFR